MTDSNLYAFCCKTVFDPAKGLSLSTLKDQYVHHAPLKVTTILTEHNGEIIFKHGIGDDGALELLDILDDLKPTGLISHTAFHTNAIQARTKRTLPFKITLIDELARSVNPALRSVSLNKLIDLYVGGGACRANIDFIEGNHTFEQLANANMQDAMLIYTIHHRLTRTVAGQN